LPVSAAASAPRRPPRAVETEEQLQRLRVEGCTEVQGYLFSEPIPADEVRLLLQRLAPRSKAVADFPNLLYPAASK
jgi:predicted signal transduction protein with EAL and GGDEF domain